jgi:hypothetical protein
VRAKEQEVLQTISQKLGLTLRSKIVRDRMKPIVEPLFAKAMKDAGMVVERLAVQPRMVLTMPMAPCRAEAAAEAKEKEKKASKAKEAEGKVKAKAKGKEAEAKGKKAAEGDTAQESSSSSSSESSDNDDDEEKGSDGEVCPCTAIRLPYRMQHRGRHVPDLTIRPAAQGSKSDASAKSTSSDSSKGSKGQKKASSHEKESSSSSDSDSGSDSDSSSESEADSDKAESSDSDDEVCRADAGGYRGCMVRQREHGPATPQPATTGQLSQKLVSAKHRAEDVKSDFPSDSDGEDEDEDEDKPAAKGVTQSQLKKYVWTTSASVVCCAGGQVLMTPPRRDQTGAQGVNVVVQQRRRRARGRAADGRQGNQGKGPDTEGQERPKTQTRRTKVAQDV